MTISGNLWRRGIIATALALARCGAPGSGADADNGAVYAAWQTGRSHFEVTASGSVVRILGTRRGPSGAHEGFLLRLPSKGAGPDLTVHVEDNVDLTGPIPLRPGDLVEVRGEYVFDPRGGLIHYTHRDPRGRHDSGFVRVGETVYQ